MTSPVWQVLRPGALTTVQDQGRHGVRHLGVGRAGALDPALAAVANRLVGNVADAAVLELTLAGPTLALPRPARIALCGAEVAARFEDGNGHSSSLPGGRPLRLPAGTLHLGRLRGGLRAWLAVAGGIDVPVVLGSRSTDLRGGFGGLHGRALRAGDVLPIGTSPVDEASPQIAHVAVHAAHTNLQVPGWWVDPYFDTPQDAPIRYLPAPWATDATTVPAVLDGHTWTVDPRSDRQGLRCAGESLGITGAEQLSAAVAPGTLQLPPDGCPLVLLADAQTVGGYPRLGHVLAADLPRLAQLRAGDALRFMAVTPAEADAVRRERAARMARLEWMIDLAREGIAA